MGRVCNGPKLLWAEFVMGRDVPEPSLTYVISPIVTKVSVLSNLRFSGCELKDNYYVSFT